MTETLTKIQSEALRAGDIVARLRDFLSKGDTRLAPLALGETARRVVGALADEARLHGVEVGVEAQSETSTVTDRVQVEQLLVNLIRNGIEAAAERTTGEKRGSESASVGRTARFGSISRITGPASHLRSCGHLFEPFTTSKPRGMGLGLLLSRQIVESHGGRLWCERTSAAGAHFAFSLPRDRTSFDVG